MRTEELQFIIHRVLQHLPRVDVLLTSVHDANKPQFQRVHAARQNVHRIRASVHKIDLGQDTDGTATLRIHLSSQFQGFRVRDVYICGRYSKDDTEVKVLRQYKGGNRNL